jgi:hypothetical protein
MNSPFDTLYYFYLTSRSKIDTAIQLALYKKKKFNESAFDNVTTVFINPLVFKAAKEIKTTRMRN